MALLAVLLGEGASEINSIGDACSGLGAAVFAYYLSGNSLLPLAKLFCQARTC